MTHWKPQKLAKPWKKLTMPWHTFNICIMCSIVNSWLSFSISYVRHSFALTGISLTQPLPFYMGFVQYQMCKFKHIFELKKIFQLLVNNTWYSNYDDICFKYSKVANILIQLVENILCDEETFTKLRKLAIASEAP